MEQINKTHIAVEAERHQLSEQEWIDLVELANRASRSKAWGSTVDSDDLAGEVLYKLASGPPLKDVFSTGYERAFVWQVTTTTLIDQIRKQRRRPTVSYDAGLSSDLAKYCATDGGIDGVDQASTDDSIRYLAHRIPWTTAERAVMERAIKEMSVEEIANSLEKPTNTVRGTISRARARAREFRDSDPLLREACSEYFEVTRESHPNNVCVL
jgi:DNA-directed RNA polymerase specialized sigma24 family protein